MSLYNFLMANRNKEDLAKELVATAKENAALRDRVDELSTELFWMKAQERMVVAWRYQPNDGLTHPAYTEREAQALAYDPNPVPLCVALENT